MVHSYNPLALISDSLQAVRYEFSHLEHADSVFAIEDGSQFVVGLNEGLIFGILEAMSANVLPELLRYLRPRHRLIANHGR